MLNDISNPSSKLENVCRVYIVACSIILMTFGAAKMISYFVPGGKADAIDEILMISNRHIFLAVGIFELCTSFWLNVERSTTKRLWVIVWISVMFLTYRAGLAMMHVVKLCSCLGGIVQWFPKITPFVAIFVKCSLGVLFIGSTTLLCVKLWLKRSGKSSYGKPLKKGMCTVLCLVFVLSICF
jgi:hypothetical protein